MLSQGGAGGIVGTDYFNTVTYTANGGTQAITGVGFQPDFVWAKSRVDTQQNILFDSVREAGNHGLISNLALSESGVSAGANGNVSSFDTNGFTVNVGTNNNPSNNYTNDTSNGGSYVAWCWKAGGSAVNNTDGSITSQVSANTAAGFSIVKFTSNASTITVGHGINKPDLIILKATSFSDSWFINCVGLTNQSDRAIRFGINGEETSNAFWNNTAPTSSVFSVGNGVSVSGQSYIAYCFHSTAYQKIGSYTGNGNNTGTVVDTGFTPRFVMIKATTTDNGGGNWIIYDNVRSTSNPRNKRLYADLNIAEQSISNYDLDFLTGATKGFQPKIGASSYGFNTLNVDYIYLAIA